MSTEWSPRSALAAEPGAQGLDGSLRQLGQELITANAADAAAGMDAQPYCSFCWSRMPTGASECADCGATVADMRAAREAAAAHDSAWTPPGYVAEAEEEPLIPQPLGKGRKAPRVVNPKPRKRRGAQGPVTLSPFAMAVVAGSVLGVVGGSAAWLVTALLTGRFP